MLHGALPTVTVAGACLDTNFERFGAADHAFAVAYRANRNIFAASTAPRARYRELHTPAGLLDCAFAMTLRTDARLLDVAAAVAIRANVLARDIQTHYPAANRRPEGHVHLIFEIAARFGTSLSSGRASVSSAEHAREDVAKSTASCSAAPATRTFEHVSEIKAAEVESAGASPASGLSAGKSAKTSGPGWSTARVGLGGCGIDVVGIKTELVVNFALFGIAQNVIGF